MSDLRATLKEVVQGYDTEDLANLKDVTIHLNIDTATLRAFLKGQLCDFDIIGWDSYLDYSEHMDICTDLRKIR